jgi:cytochrome c5
MKGGMRTAVATLVALLYVCALSERWLEGQAQGNARARPRAPAQGTSKRPALPAATVSLNRALINQYCVACHNDRLKSAAWRCLR